MDNSNRTNHIENRLVDQIKHQIEARGLDRAPAASSAVPDIPFYPSATCATPQATAGQWAKEAVTEVFARTRKTGNHVCKPAVCHKGAIGKKGFCRMYYWHWVRHTNEKNKVVAKRRHGLRLHKDGTEKELRQRSKHHHK